MIEVEERDRVIWRPDLQKAMGVASETIRRYMLAGKLPAPDVSMSQKKLGWRRRRDSTIHVLRHFRSNLFTYAY